LSVLICTYGGIRFRIGGVLALELVTTSGLFKDTNAC